jgi:hypothetical protein
MDFKNIAGERSDNDAIVRAELGAAGIPCMEHEMLLATSGEVKSSVIGTLHGWTFRRAWRYWVCQGPGIEVKAAERLHAAHGRTVRVAGHCGCPSPREWFNGLACGLYHVDDSDGLKALADTIKEIVQENATLACKKCKKCGHRIDKEWYDDHDGLCLLCLVCYSKERGRYV